jgi:hypothetical protein
MSILDVLRVGGAPYNWNSTLSLFDGFPNRGIVEVSFSDKLDVETIYSQTQDGVPIDATGGQYEVDSFSIKMLSDSADKLTSYLSLKPPFIGSYGRTKFSFNLTATEPLILGATPLVLDAPECRIIGVKEARARGVEALLTELTLWCRTLSRNGKTLYVPAIPGIG